MLRQPQSVLDLPKILVDILTHTQAQKKYTVAAAPECSFWQEVMTKSGKQKYTQTPKLLEPSEGGDHFITKLFLDMCRAEVSAAGPFKRIT